MFNKSKKKSVLMFNLLINFLIIKLIILNVCVVNVSTITEEQRLEIAKLKSELTNALEEDYDENVAAKGVIVQPTWIKGSKPDTKQTVKVEVNAENRKETAKLRAEIGLAVAKDNYATKGVTKTQDIKNLEASFAQKGKSKEALKNVVGSQQDSPNQEFVGAAADQEQQNDKAPNIITANIGDDTEIDIRKLQRLEVSKRRTKEVLILKYIEEDFSFDLGPEVVEWEHIVHAGEEYFIGRRLKDLLIVRKDAAKYEKSMVVDVGQLISDIETYTYWNLDQQQQEGVILISSGDKVLWYRANNETQEIELYWDWLVGNVITGLTYFTLDSKDYLVISSNQSSLAGHYALNIYQYKLQTKEFWIVQRLQLEKVCDKVTVLNTGRDVILAIPQNNTADIYTFNPHEAAFSHIRFQLKRSVKAEGILTIAGFKMGGRSYLALTGHQPQILLYQQGDFVSKTILGNNFGLVELFFPIPIRTYRDDLILLVQHRVDFMTHTLTVVETLIWDGEAFETSIPVPCHMGQHVVYGVSCMLDLQRDEGLKGAALLRRGDEISVIVPRHQAESGLFRFHTELLAKNSELLDLQDIFEFLKDWVKEQDDLIKQASDFLNFKEEDLNDVSFDLTDLEILKTPEFLFQGEVGEIYVNDYKWSLEDSNIDLEFLIQQIEDLDRSLNPVRQRRNLKDMEHNDLEFDELWVEDLEVDMVNNEKYFIQNGELDFEGLIELEELEVLSQILEKEKRQLNEEDFVLEGDLEFDLINGLSWSDLQDNLVFRTQKQNLKELEVEGEVICENLLSIKTLNTLDFPEDYMLSNGPAISIVQAEKHFAQSLSASSVDTNGLINGKNPEDAITLMDDQQWQGMPTFQHLEVQEILELKGEVQGRNINNLPQNPSLQESNIVEASCHFNQLLVNGPVILKGDMDDEPLALRFKDIILKPLDPLEEILVPSSKSFDMVMFPIDFQLENNSINQIPAPDFVTVHTQQNLNIKNMEGYVYFYNLTLSGSYDGVKLEEVLKEIIMLDKPQDLATTELIFQQEFKANKVNILETLNYKPIKDLQTLNEDLILKSVEFEHLLTPQADFAQDILGSGKLNNIELHDVVKDKNWHEPPIKGNIFLNELILKEGLQTDELHGIKAEYLLDFMDKIEELPDMVLNGQIQVDHIHVTGDVQINKLNGLLFDEEIQLTTIKLNKPNYLSTQITFQNRLILKQNLNLMADFRGQYVPDLIEDIIIKSSNSCIEVKAPKSFLKPVTVLQNLQASALNGKSLDLVAWKNKNNNFQGSLNIKGNLVVHSVELQGNLNQFKWQKLQEKLYFDQNLNNFVLRNSIEFSEPLTLEDFYVSGNLNDVPNLADFFENLIYKNHLCLLKGKNTFTGRVTIDKGAFIRNLNGYDLQYLFNNLVYIHGSQPVIIQAPVTFEDNLQANELQIKKSLSLPNINSCSLQEWLNNTLRVDQDQNISHFLQFSEGSLDGNSLHVSFIENIDLDRVITLNTPQTFNDSVKFSEVYLNGVITCKGLINNKSLEEEFNNTLMTYGPLQHISTTLNIQTIVVLGDLTILGPVNTNKNLQDVATLQEDLTLQSPLYIQSLYTPQIIMKDKATGIDFEKWFTSAVKYQDIQAQYITGNWSCKYLAVKTGPKDFQYMINGYEPWQYYSYIRSARSQEENYAEDKEICEILDDIQQNLENQGIHLKYLEEKQMDLNFREKNPNETLRKVFYLKTKQEDLLLINFKCKTLIYKWLGKEQKFVYKNSFEAGPIEQIELVPSAFNSKNSKWEFITSYESWEPLNCSVGPLNKWQLVNDTLKLDETTKPPKGLLFQQRNENNSSLWSLEENTLKQWQWFPHKTQQKWQLPRNSNKSRYQFVPYKNQQEILLTDGEHMVFLNNNLNKNFKKSIEIEKVVQSTILPKDFEVLNTEIILKPNNTVTRSFVFADFKQVIERILIDLALRLQQQINITQLSIPESDLFDEHLITDFLAIIEELRKQNIYSQEEFNITFDNLTIPENLAQVLAARVVEITWPVVVEIEEIHLYLKTNKTHDHPLCSCISKSLRNLIKDVLYLAYNHTTTQEVKDYAYNLTKVIERIRVFEKDLENFVKALENHQEKGDLFNKEKENLEISASSREFHVLEDNLQGFMFKEDTYLPGFKQGEILALQAGSLKNPLQLWAVTNSKTSFMANNNPGIYLYLQNLKEQIYQVITANKPRSLQHLRIQQESLLFYIENCCHIKILRYRGSLGYQKFSEIHTQDYIQQILTVSLAETENLKYFLIVLLKNDIQFYEIVLKFPYNVKEFKLKIPNKLNC